MKQLYFFVITLSYMFIGFAQNTYVQIELVNPNIGEPIYQGNAVFVSSSTDSGLNNIFNLYDSAGFYESIYPESIESFSASPIYTRKSCNGCDINQFLLDLMAYDSVVAFAAVENDSFYMANGLTVFLVDEIIGVPTGSNSDNIIITNDAGLNQIFLDYNVVNYVPQSNASAPLNAYSLKCRCNANDLKMVLDNYTSVISNSSRVSYGMLLSIEEYEQLKIEIYPNPFIERITIKTNKVIKSLLLYDILGKQVYNSSSVLDFETFSSTLKSGTYILKVISEEGNTQTKKMIKL